MPASKGIEAALERLRAKFDEKWEQNPEFRRKLEGKDRDILIDLGADGSYHLVVRNGYLQSVAPGTVEKPDAHVRLTGDDLLAIFGKTLHPLAAFASGRVKVKASLRDIILVRAFLGG